MNNRGLSLTELTVAVSVTGFLLASSYFSFENWLARYKIEKSIREMYADLMKARVLAVDTNRFYYVILNPKSYTLYEDKDGDNNPEPGEEVATFPKKFDYGLDWNGSGSKITIDRRGQVTPNRSLWIMSSIGPDSDCLTVFRTRILTGKARFKGGTFAECVH